MKPKVLVCVLTGIERHNWINPDLMLNIIAMVRDTRFDVNFFPVRDARPFEGARNMTIVGARQINADWMISFDNDNFLPGPVTPLDIIAAAGDNQHVIGVPVGVGNGDTYRIYPNGLHNGTQEGPFREETTLGGAILMVRNTVWKKIKGPWFRWVHVESETLAPDNGTQSEDSYFCNLVGRHGFKVWSHKQAAGHYRSVDITQMVCTMSQRSR